MWKQEFTIRLQPGETKTVTAATEYKFPAKQVISVVLSDKKEAILAVTVKVQDDAQAVAPVEAQGRAAGQASAAEAVEGK